MGDKKTVISRTRVFSKSTDSLLRGVAIFVLLSGSLRAQLSEGGIPYTFTHAMKSAYNEYSAPAINRKALLLEDEEEQAKGVPFRFGLAHPVDLSLHNSGTWEFLSSGEKLWRLKITCPGATTINLVYSDFWLPERGKLFIYNEARTEVIGAFTARNNKDDGFFATGLLRGQSITLEYLEPAKVSAPGRIGIKNIVHGYKDIFKDYPLWEKDYGSSGSCNVNVNCTQGAVWQNEKRAAVMVLTNNASRICSGALVNNVRQDLTPYFLTANHCIVNESPNTWIFMFNYESPFCTNADGPLKYTLSGSVTNAYSATSDFALLKLNEAPPDSFHAHWAGWDAGASTSILRSVHTSPQRRYKKDISNYIRVY